MIAMPYQPANWFTPIGAWKSARELDKRGWPDMKDWRFITLTLDPSLFEDSEHGFDIGNRRFREFVSLIRDYLGLTKEELLWFKKLEFTKKGWAHWHVPLGYKKPIPADLLRKFWGLGRVEVKRMFTSDFTYLIKYVCKASHLPDWALERKRLRVWSASLNFWTSSPARAVSPASSQETKKVVEKPPQMTDTIRERIQRWAGLVTLYYGKQRGRHIVRRELLADGATFKDIILQTVDTMSRQIAQGRLRKTLYSVSPWRVSLPGNKLKEWGLLYEPVI